MNIMSLQLYILRRFLFVIPLLLGITVVSFLIANAIPADPLNANLPPNALNDERLIEAFREKWGLNKPLVVQYLTYLSNLLRGDLGVSIKTHNPIAQDIQQFLPATIELASFSIVIGLTLGIGVGIISAVWKDSLIDYVARTFVVLGVSFPVFVLALIGLTVLHVQLGWVAGPGRLDFIVSEPPRVTGLFTIDSLLAGQWAKLGNVFSHLVLPSFILGSYIAGIIARITRSSLLEVMEMDYIRTARSKGVREQWVIVRHALSNAMIPVVTVIGLSFGNLLTGSVLIESIFAWPGIGRYAFRASTSQDFPAIMGVSFLIAFIYVLVNFVVDILYYFIDPRIRVA
jgi:peptide/nickel transport system permease protein